MAATVKPMAAYYWIVYKTGTKTNPVIVSTPTTGTLESNLAAGDAVTINGVSYTLTSAGGPFSSKAAAQASPSWKSGKPPPSTAQTQGWVVIPEGEIGQVTNILATESDTLTLGGSEIANLSKVFAAATGNPGGTYTVQELNTAQQVVAAQNSGLEVYTTQAAAQSAANALNNTSGGISSWEQAIEQFFSAVSSVNLWIRVAKIGIGSALIIVGLAKITGADQKLGKAVSTGVKVAPFL